MAKPMLGRTEPTSRSCPAQRPCLRGAQGEEGARPAAGKSCLPRTAPGTTGKG